MPDGESLIADREWPGQNPHERLYRTNRDEYVLEMHERRKISEDEANRWFLENGFTDRLLEELRKRAGGELKEVGFVHEHGFATLSFPLRKDHWIFNEEEEPAPMSMRMGTDNPRREEMENRIRMAARYAIRESTRNGKDMNFNPDAMVQNFIIGTLGYYTPSGCDSENSAKEEES